VWRGVGERICVEAPASPGVYVLRNDKGSAVYVGKATNLRRRLRAHFARRRWAALKPAMARVTDAEWHEVGSELEALLREATVLTHLPRLANAQPRRPALKPRVLPRALVRVVIVLLPFVEAVSAEIVAVRAEGPWLIQRTRRNGADLAVHTSRLMRFF